MSEETLESIVGSGEPPITSDEEVAEVVEEEKEEPEKTPDPPEKKRSVLDDIREERSKRRELQEENERLKTKPVDEDEAVKQARSWFDKEFERRTSAERQIEQEAKDKALEDKLAEIDSLKAVFEDFDE